MPVYDYRCTRCQHRWEEARAFGDHPEGCPECGGPLRQVYHPFTFKFAMSQRKPRQLGGYNERLTERDAVAAEE